jgi:cell wall-associated NlpC family hydrolase
MPGSDSLQAAYPAKVIYATLSTALWQEPGYIPAPGDIIFFDWEPDGSSDHVGIVEYVEGEVVHTVEGNTSNSCARRSYRLDSKNICGYGTPMY